MAPNVGVTEVWCTEAQIRAMYEKPHWDDAKNDGVADEVIAKARAFGLVRWQFGKEQLYVVVGGWA